MNFGQFQLPICRTLVRNYTNMVVGECEIKTFEVVIVVLLLLLLSIDVIIPKCTSLIIFGQVDCPNILKFQNFHPILLL